MRWMPLAIVAMACTDKSVVDPGDGDVVDTGDGSGSIVYIDADRDGVYAEDDCDDNDWQVYPGAEEICDDKDNDCDGETDEGFDADEDGALPMDACAHGTDCNDADKTIPREEVPYDGVDQDCDGTDLIDLDGDGFDGFNGGGNDCDDEDATVHPGADEIALDDIDQDCDGLDLLDGDGDGFAAESEGGDDCDDTDPSVRPDAIDWMNDGVDGDCDAVDGALVSVDRAQIQVHGTAGEYELLGAGVGVCDLDGDGKPDLVVTAPYANGYDGVVGIFYGRYADTWHDAMSMDDADTLIDSDSPVVGFGVDCADMDGDGYEDLLVGQGEIHFGTLDSHYAIRVFYGFGGMFPTALELGDEGTIFTHVFLSPPGLGNALSLEFTASDLDGDGDAELIVDMDDADSIGGVSEIWIVNGYTHDSLETLERATDWVIGDVQGDTVSLVAGVSDADGGGSASDLMVGQPRYRPGLPSGEEELSGYPQGGLVSLVNRPDDDQASVPDAAYLSFSSPTDAGLGASGAVMDLDGDGALDGLFGAPLAEGGKGAVYMVSNLAEVDPAAAGVPGVDAVQLDIIRTWTLIGEPGGSLGADIVAGGDVFGDGTQDLLITEPGGGGGLGVVWLLDPAELEGGDSALIDSAFLGIEAQYPTDNIGSTMALADFDGDGMDDIMIASDHHGSVTAAGIVPSGRVSIFLSSAY